jgi:hypothetical protein
MNNTVTNAALNILNIVKELRYSLKDVLDDADKKTVKHSKLCLII